MNREGQGLIRDLEVERGRERGMRETNMGR